MANGEPPDQMVALLRAALAVLRPNPSFRRRAWLEFQRALDPLGPIKPLPPARS